MVQISAGEYHSLVLTDSALYAFGENNQGQCGLGTTNNTSGPKKVRFFDHHCLASLRIKQIAAGWKHSLVLMSDGQVFGCGKSS
jgi:alpha-tubulin suppressor-like RCC1 family protein